MKSRLFHAVVIVGASFGACALTACTAMVESPPPAEGHDAGRDSYADAGHVSEAGLYPDVGDASRFLPDAGASAADAAGDALSADAAGDALSPDTGWPTTK
jgi:hypothetical protein